MSDDRLSLQELLLSEDKQKPYAQNIITWIWRDILEAVFLPSQAIGRWDSLMRQYVQRVLNDPLLPEEATPKNTSSMKGNLRKELMSPHMTWLNFIKGLYFLNVYQCVLRIECYWQDGSHSAHPTTVFERNNVRSLSRLFLKDILTEQWLEIMEFAFEGNIADHSVTRPGDHIQRWRRLVEQYLDDPKNGIGKSLKKRTSVKGNLKKELLMRDFISTADTEHYLTWKSLEKGIRLLNPARTQFTVTCYWRPGYGTHHSTTLHGSRGFDATTVLRDTFI